MLEILDHIRSDISKLDRKAVFALVYAAVGLTLIFYLKNQESLAKVLTGTRFEEFGNSIAYSSDNNLPALGWWVGVVTVFYFVLPALAIKFLYRERLSDYGLKAVIEPGFGKLLAACVAVMLPSTYLMSLKPRFAAKYTLLRCFQGEPSDEQALLTSELSDMLQV